MNKSPYTKRNRFLFLFGFLVLITAIFLYILLPFDNSHHSVEDDFQEINKLLIEAAEDLNDVLPQQLALNTMFDSVGVGMAQLMYYYTVTDITREQFVSRHLEDSLYAEAEERIPCTLWRPMYMNGVSVTFTYYSSDREKILEFTRMGDQCH